MQAVIPRLLGLGHDVVGIDKVGSTLLNPPYMFYEKDLVGMTGKWHIGKIDMVIHAAATIYGIGGFNDYCADILGNDITMTRNVLNFAMDNQVEKFVYISSSMVYERCMADDFGVSEYMVEQHDYPVPLTDYGLSKYVGERLVRSYKRQYDIPFVIWRPFNIITPYEMARGETGTSHVFADFFNAVLIKQMRNIPIISPGTQSRCFTWIDDVADAIADYSDKVEGAYNLGSNEEISMVGLLDKILVRSNRNPMDYGKIWLASIANDVIRRKPNCQLARNFGWKPKVNLNEAIDRCLAHYAEMGYK